MAFKWHDAKLPENVKREIGQCFIFGFHGHKVSAEIASLIRDGYLGNVILMKRNVKDAAQTRRVVHMLQQIAKDAGHERPLMIGTDQENGLVSAFSVAGSDAAGTQFPGAMALAATGDTSITEEVYQASAGELKLVGINWAFSPVADVNSDPKNPVIGARSFGDQPKAVGQHVSAATRGMTAAGVAASLKHFPGHGATATDSHLALPTITHNLNQLQSIDLVPFAASLSSPTIMTGHVALSHLGEMDEGLPASLSKRVTTDLLRRELGYEGLVVTDCLEMAAVAARDGGVPRGAVNALQAGADIIMICHTHELHLGSLEAAYAAVLSGELDIELLRASGRRIAALKDRFAGTWADVLPDGSNADDGWATAWSTQKELSAVIARRAYASSTAILRDPSSFMQRGIQSSDSVLLITPTPQALNLAVDDAEGVLRTKDGRLRNTAGASYLAFATAIRRRLEVGGGTLEHTVFGPDTTDEEMNEMAAKAQNCKRVVCVTRDAHRPDAEWQSAKLENVIRAGDKNAVVVSSCAPYDVLGPAFRETAALATFEFTAPALEAAAEALFKERQAVGTTPVATGRPGARSTLSV